MSDHINEYKRLFMLIASQLTWICLTILIILAITGLVVGTTSLWRASAKKLINLGRFELLMPKTTGWFASIKSHR